ncbi:MAG: hypothetical protein BMS9Abin39_1106 [Ignavibacteria bacterium]|nr:MAG: hypothetical protein BMS9Abin39_1106 [Ignavibacteria bacterium]
MSFMQLTYAQIESKTQKNISLDQRLHIGEEFTYIVKYAFIDLGELKISVYAKDTIDGKTIYKSIAYIDSYEGLPFVNLHQIYESWFDSTLYPVYFQALIFNENDTAFTKYYFEKNKKIHVVKGKLNKTPVSLDTTVNLDNRYQDGLSLLFYSRFGLKGDASTSVVCYVNEDTSSASINYYARKEEVTIDAVDYGIETFRIDGEANFIGIFGLTGYFEGWFSNDEYHVPVLANLQVILGSVELQLMDWNNEIWQPPVYKE